MLRIISLDFNDLSKRPMFSISENLISLVDKENSSLKEKIDSAFSLLNIASLCLNKVNV